MAPTSRLLSLLMVLAFFFKGTKIRTVKFSRKMFTAHNVEITASELNVLLIHPAPSRSSITKVNSVVKKFWLSPEHMCF